MREENVWIDAGFLLYDQKVGWQQKIGMQQNGRRDECARVCGIGSASSGMRTTLHAPAVLPVLCTRAADSNSEVTEGE